MSRAWFKKQPGEQFMIGLEFNGKLPPATTINTGTVSAYRLDTGQIDNSVVDSTAAMITGTRHAIIHEGLQRLR